MPALPAIMVRIAECESGFRQFRDDGSVLRGEVNPQDVGIFQINEYWNGAEAKRFGYDIYTAEGNMAFALHLYEKRGTQPWNASKRCWASEKRDV